MSQTETLLLILVGFSLGALIFLFAARALWRAGVRLGARRTKRQIPGNVAELRNERDSLRGEYARLSQKLNARLEQARLDMAEQMAEVSRHRNRLARMTADLNDRDAELERHRLRVAELEEDLADKTTRLSDTEEQLRATNDELMRNHAELTSLRSSVTQLEALNASNLQVGGAALPVPAFSEEATAERLRQRIDQLSGLSQAIAAERNIVESSGQQVVDPLLQEKLDTVARETADLHEELTRLDTAWAAKLGEPADSGDSQPDGKPRAVANVISLAQRIRALQKDLAR